MESVPFVFPDVAGRKVLVLGLGGGCDIITAFAFSRLLKGEAAQDIVYANTKVGEVGRVEPVTAHILRVAGPLIESDRRVQGRGRAWIDHSVPRSPNGSPWIVLLADELAERELVDEIRSLAFDLVIGVDTGGDSIANKRGKGHRGRDQRMLRVLQQTGLSLLHVVVAPGSDGEATCEDLQTEFRQHAGAGRYLGCFDLGPLLPVFQSFRGSLGPTRTPQIILSAVEGQLTRTAAGQVIVPRGRKPAVPASWLTTGFVFAPGAAVQS